MSGVLPFPTSFTLQCSQSTSGVWTITSPWNSGFLIAGPSLQEALSQVVAEMEMICGLPEKSP